MTIHLLTQVLLLVSLPFIAHFYSAEQIGQWAICTTICSIVITTGGGKFYFSIFGGISSALKNHLTWLTLMGAALFSVILMTVLFALASWWGIYSFLWESELKASMILVLGLYCFTAICNLLLEHLLAISADWNFLNVVRLIKALTYILVIFVFKSFGILSLLLALLAGQMIGLLLIWTMRFDMKFPTLFKWKELVSTLAEYKHNFNFGMSKSFIINAYEHLMAIWIQSMFGAAMLGQFSMADRLARFPMQGLGQPITERLYQKLGITSPEHIYPLLRKFLPRIFLMIGLLSLGFALFGPYLLITFLGNKWNTAASLMQYYVLWIPAIFCLASIRNLPFVLKAQKAFFRLELGFYGVLILLFMYFWSLDLDFMMIIPLKLISESAVFIAATIMMTRFSRKITAS